MEWWLVLMNMEAYISNFRNEMKSLGYVACEVEAFIHDIVEDRRLNKLSQEECDEIIDTFTSYLMFARKCKQVS